VNNLQNMLGRAKYGLLVLVDSDIRVGPEYLGRIASEVCAGDTGLVTCLYRAGEAPGFAARLEAVGITGEFAPGVLVAEMTGGASFAFGATIALKRDTLEAIGGFQAIADYLADDYMLGNLAHRAGHAVRLSSCVVETVLAPTDIGAFLLHQIRWARGIRACRPLGHTGLIITNAIVVGLLYTLTCGLSAASILLFAVAAAARMAAAWTVGVWCLGDRLLANSLWLVPVRDFFSFFIWCMALAGKKVEWRGKRYRIAGDGKLAPIE
jgi:ceramide glucosyltransferase